MELYFKENYNTSVANILRKAGYFQNFDRREGKTSYIRRLSGNSHYPRFHSYILEEKPGYIHLNLHLDMKKVSYEGSNRHDGEYDSDQVKQESARIQTVFAQYQGQATETTPVVTKQKSNSFWKRVIKNMFR